MIQTSDNTTCIIENEKDKKCLSDIANLCDFGIENKQNLLVFPQKWQLGIDRKSRIFDLGKKDGKDILITNNIMGFIGYNGTILKISSRFYPNGDDYFLHYMLCKVLGINVVNLSFPKGKGDIHDFLPYLFPSYLQNALSQGLYKEYKRNQYNDANVRGAIDVNRHIKINIPFTGKIAYTTREYSYDNPVTQLIRHTVEHLRTREYWHGILAGNAETKANVSQIEYATPSYRKNDLQKIIKTNLKPVNHPYFTKYRELQKLCLQILRREKTNFGSEKNQIHGLLFDGAWLWEEYLNRVFQENKLGWSHPDNRTGTGVDYLFEDGQRIFPDFIKKNADGETAARVGDAKYKFIDKRGNEAGREDYYQLITYMYRYSCDTGFLLFPHSGDSLYVRTRQIKGHERKSKCIEIGLKVEQQAQNFKIFVESMEENERKFISAIKVK